MKWGKILALRFGNIALVSFGVMAVVLAVIGIQRGGAYLETIPYSKSLALFSLCLAATLLGVSVVSGFRRMLSLKFWAITLACYGLLCFILVLHSSVMFGIYKQKGAIPILPRIPAVGAPMPGDAFETDGPFLRLKAINEDSVGRLLDSRPAFLLLSASWCGPCKRLKRDMRVLIKQRGMPRVPLYLVMLEEHEHSQAARKAMRSRGGDFHHGIPTLLYRLHGKYYIQTGYGSNLVIHKGPNTLWQYLNPFIKTNLEKILYAENY